MKFQEFSDFQSNVYVDIFKLISGMSPGNSCTLYILSKLCLCAWIWPPFWLVHVGVGLHIQRFSLEYFARKDEIKVTCRLYRCIWQVNKTQIIVFFMFTVCAEADELSEVENENILWKIFKEIDKAAVCWKSFWRCTWKWPLFSWGPKNTSTIFNFWLLSKIQWRTLATLANLKCPIISCCREFYCFVAKMNVLWKFNKARACFLIAFWWCAETHV